MTITLETFQHAARQRERRPGKKPAPYDAELRRFAIDYVDEQVAQGKSQATAVEELGVSYQTLRNWRGSAPSTAGGFRRVRVSAVAEAVVKTRSATLVSPKGYRVEGLGLDDIASLLEKLG